MTTNNKPTQEELNEWHADPKNWKFGIFYFNPKDTRVFPPKRIAGLGWTINFANPRSIFFMIALLAVVFYVTSLLHR